MIMDTDPGTVENYNHTTKRAKMMDPVESGFQQVRWDKKRTTTLGSKRGARKKMMKMQEQYVKATWQAYGNYGTDLSQYFKLETQIPTVNTGEMLLPVYAFNLSTLPTWRNNIPGVDAYASVPMWRLKKGGTAHASYASSYFWTKQGQSHTNTNNGLPVSGWPAQGNAYQWTVYDQTSALGNNKDWIHDWVKYKIHIQNATGRQTRFRIMVVSFPNPSAGPLRTYDACTNISTNTWTTDLAFDVRAAGDDNENQINFWDRFLAGKINHPLYSAKIEPPTTRNMKIWKQTTFDIGPESTTNIDARGREVIKTGFLKINQACQSDISDKQQINNASNLVGVIPATGPATQVSQNPSFSQGIGHPQYETNKWLIIVAENRGIKTTAFSATLDPSFSITVDSKWSYKN